jgi:mRNA-degrading endonuclease toxin of MazEF toxin-antitoxin module
MNIIYAGDVYLCDFSYNAYGSMQDGLRPCVIVDNKMALAFSPCIHCVPITSQHKDFKLHYRISIEEKNGLSVESTALCEQYTLIDKSQLVRKLGHINKIDLIYIVELCKKNFPFTQ